MTDKEALLAGVYGNILDHTRKLIYADWIEEHEGEEGELVARFIRESVERQPKGGPLTRSWNTSLFRTTLMRPEDTAVRRRVLGPLIATGKGWDVDVVHGFPVRITAFDGDYYIENAAAVMAHYPHVEEVSVVSKVPLGRLYQELPTGHKTLWTWEVDDSRPSGHHRSQFTIPSAVAFYLGGRLKITPHVDAPHQYLEHREAKLDLNRALSLYGRVWAGHKVVPR